MTIIETYKNHDICDMGYNRFAICKDGCRLFVRKAENIYRYLDIISIEEAREIIDNRYTFSSQDPVKAWLYLGKD